MADNDAVLITHPDTPSARMETTEFMLRELWRHRGWRRAEAKEPSLSPARPRRAKRKTG
jgi:hypothetical protein